MNLRLLFVEDEEGQQALLRDQIDDWNERHPQHKIELSIAGTTSAAQELLDATRFDAALLDLRLPAGDHPGVVASGGQLAELSVSNFGIPVGIISGHPADYDATGLAQGMLRFFNKVDLHAYPDAVAWIGSLVPMLKILRQTRSNIRRAGAEVFAKRVWPRWTAYQDLPEMAEGELGIVVTRQYASHIAELMGLDGNGNATWHPFENYVLPALQDSRPYTGDLFQFDDGLWIVLTPQCDMSNDAVSNVVMAACSSDVDGDWVANVALLKQELGADKAKRRDQFFRDRVNQNVGPARHFLPPLLTANPIMVQFKQLKTVPLAVLKSSLDKRIASVSAPFLSNLVQRFGAYISRTGQPNIDYKHFG